MQSVPVAVSVGFRCEKCSFNIKFSSYGTLFRVKKPVLTATGTGGTPVLSAILPILNYVRALSNERLLISQALLFAEIYPPAHAGGSDV